MTLASIAYALRYYNMTDEEDAQIPSPWNYQNIPQAVRKWTVEVHADKVYKRHAVECEEFADGSSFGVTVSR